MLEPCDIHVPVMIANNYLRILKDSHSIFSHIYLPFWRLTPQIDSEGTVIHSLQTVHAVGLSMNGPGFKSFKILFLFHKIMVKS